MRISTCSKLNSPLNYVFLILRTYGQQNMQKSVAAVRAGVIEVTGNQDYLVATQNGTF